MTETRLNKTLFAKEEEGRKLSSNKGLKELNSTEVDSVISSSFSRSFLVPGISLSLLCTPLRNSWLAIVVVEKCGSSSMLGIFEKILYRGSESWMFIFRGSLVLHEERSDCIFRLVVDIDASSAF